MIPTSGKTEDPRDQPPRPSLPAAGFDPPSVAMTALVLLFLLFFIAFFSVFARRCFSDIHGPDMSHRHTAPLPLINRYQAGAGVSAPSYPASGMDPSTIRALPLLSYTRGKTAAAAAAGCVVCLSEFEEEESVKLIPACGHVFHPGCIDSWLASRGSCPICRCSEIFGSGLLRGGEVTVDVEEEFEAEVLGEIQVEEEGRGGDGKVGRSRSWCSRIAGRERTVFLRRTCSV